jgi:hypothetical protein
MSDREKGLAAITAEFYKTISASLEAWVERSPNPDRPFIGRAGPAGGLSPREVLANVRDGTPLGEKLLATWMKLAVQREMSAFLPSFGEESDPDSMP